jgi:hypothetical protein
MRSLKRFAASLGLLTQLLGACASTGSPGSQPPAGPATSDVPAPKAPAAEAKPDDTAEARAVARQFLGDRKGGAWKAGYEWLTVGRLYWVMGPLEPSRLVAVVDGGRAPVLLTGDVAALKDFLALQFNGRLPGASALNDIAQLVKDGILGRGGSIATPEFFARMKQGGLDDWLKGREHQPAALQKVCSGIRAALSKNEWTLEFNVLTTAGGVEVVRASGTASPLTLEHVSVGVVKARGEFFYPLEG